MLCGVVSVGPSTLTAVWTMVETATTCREERKERVCESVVGGHPVCVSSQAEHLLPYLVQLAGGVDDRLEGQGHDDEGRGRGRGGEAAEDVLGVRDGELELGDGGRVRGGQRVLDVDPGGAHELPLQDEAFQGRGAVRASRRG